jgi:hypothetical protein
MGVHVSGGLLLKSLSSKNIQGVFEKKKPGFDPGFFDVCMAGNRYSNGVSFKRICSHFASISSVPKLGM